MTRSPACRALAAKLALALSLALSLALFLAALPAHAFSVDDLRDPEDGRFDTSRFLLDLKGVLPVPIVITEPALGYGLGLGLLYFRRNAPPPDGPAAVGRHVPPDVTALAGFRTENGSRGGGLGHLGFSRDGQWRYLGAVGRVSLNLDLYADASPVGGPATEGLAYNLDARFLLADVRRRIGDTPWMAGLRYARADAASRFDVTRPPSVPERQLDTTIAGMAVVAEYDGRDNIFTPNRGSRLTLLAHDFGTTWGGDDEFRLYRAALNSHFMLDPRLVLSTRADLRASTGDTPFYARPFIELRGIPALRYQGDRVAVLEVEGRWNLDGRWSLLGFGGVGRAAGAASDLGSAPNRGAAGIGVRYLLARLLGLQAGIDVARGPEENAFYIIVGSAWR